jgi:MYXO-CTERM domain-containing protein
MIPAWLGVAVVFSSSIALARPELLTVTEPSQLPPDAVLVGESIFLNNCSTPCVVKPGASDATTDTSNIVSMQATFNEFAEWDPASGSAYVPGEWEQVVQCVREVYSPYGVTVTDVRPTTEYSEAIVAGTPQQVGLPTGVGGVGPSSGDCSPMTNQIAFAFAETAVSDFAQEDDNNRVWGICWVIAQEIAHAYGLPNHEIKFTDGQSACSDPMTYQADCGGQKFFRNKSAQCGDFAAKTCVCTPTVNSHLKLTTVFGPGTSLIAPPTVSIVSPTGGTVATGFVVHPMAASRRGIGHVDLYLNGHMWATAPGAPFGNAGQPESVYTLTAPATVPDGVIDVVAKAYDDLEGETDSGTVTVTKGAPCVDATTCAKGQQCAAGKCFWDAPTGVLGDQCTYNEFCTSGLCQDSDIGQYCSQACVVGSVDGCPAMFDCIATSDAQGVCLPHGSGSSGCCSVGSESNRSVLAHIGLGLFVFGLVARRRRRKL